MLYFDNKSQRPAYFEERISENFCVVSDFETGQFYVAPMKDLSEMENKSSNV